MAGSILTLNAGSFSFKFAVFPQDATDEMTAMVRGTVTELDATPHLIAHNAGGVVADRPWAEGQKPSFAAVLEMLLQFVDIHSGADGLAAVGHRVVHGGADHLASSCITPALLGDLKALIRLDPLHMLLGSLFEATNRQWDADEYRTTNSWRPRAALSTPC